MMTTQNPMAMAKISEEPVKWYIKALANIYMYGTLPLVLILLSIAIYGVTQA